MLVACERWVGDRDRLLFWPKVLLETIAALLPHLGWSCSTVAQSPLSTAGLNSASCLQLTQAVYALVILLFNVHLLPLFLFTQVHLLIDGSVEGQYIAHRHTCMIFDYYFKDPLWYLMWPTSLWAHYNLYLLTSFVGWGCRIYRQHNWRGVRPPSNSFLDMILNNLISPEAPGNGKTTFIAITPRSTLIQSGSTWLGPIYGTIRNAWHLNCVQINYWCLMESFVIQSNTWKHLTVCKRMSYVESNYLNYYLKLSNCELELNCLYYIAILGTIWLSANQWKVFNRIINIKEQLLSPFHCLQTNDKYWIASLVFVII